MEDLQIQFDFYPAGEDYEIVMQDANGGENSISIMETDKFLVFIDHENNETDFKDFFGLASFYMFDTKESLDAFIAQFPKPIRDAIQKHGAA